MAQTDKIPKRRLYENTTKSQEKWLNDMQKLLNKMPKDFYMLADGSLHVFSVFQDGSQFTACFENEANTACIYTFLKCPVDGGDFW